MFLHHNEREQTMSDASPLSLNPYTITTPQPRAVDRRYPRLRRCLIALTLTMHAVQVLLAVLFYVAIQFVNHGRDPTVLFSFASGPMTYGLLITSAAVGLLAVAVLIGRNGLRTVAGADLPWLLSGIIHAVVLAIGVYV